jgi:hypothetical protein
VKHVLPLGCRLLVRTARPPRLVVTPATVHAATHRTHPRHLGSAVTRAHNAAVERRAPSTTHEGYAYQVTWAEGDERTEDT